MIASAAESKAASYVDAVIRGELVTCELVRCAVERHVRDLDRQSTKRFPFHFDARHGAAAVDFFPLMLRHSIGDFAGMPFELEPWQAFAVSSIFGWKRDDDNSRRFRKVYWSMARKNGKSCVAAGIAYLLAMMDINPNTGKPESVAEVILSATKREQAEKVIYAEMQRMRIQSKEIEQLSTAKNNQITFAHNDGSIRCVGSDKPYDGLNPHAVVKDELHAWKEHHRKFYDTMETGSGYRCQPISLTVTTAGDDQSHLWKEEYDYAAGVARGEFKDEQLFSYCFELDEKDDPLDEANWPKANPNLDISIRSEYLRQLARPAKTSALALNRFTRYHGNRVVSSTEKAFEMDQWDACEGELSDWSEADAIGGGVDLGGRDDLAAWSLVARFPIEGEGTEDDPVWRYEVKAQAYIADSTTRDLTRQPFAEWVFDGTLRKSKYPIADLTQDFIVACEEHGVSDVAYDPHNGQPFAERIEEEGIAIASMAQNSAHFHEPIADLKQAMVDGRLRHDGNPLLRWCVKNAILISNRQDRWMFDKRDSSDKIDPAVAMTMAYKRAMVAKQRAEGSLYL